MIEVAPVFLEAVRRRQCVGVVAEVVLAEFAGGVAEIEQELRAVFEMVSMQQALAGLIDRQLSYEKHWSMSGFQHAWVMARWTLR